MKSLVLPLIFLFLVTVVVGQEIKIAPKSKVDAHFMNVNLSPSGLYIAASLLGSKDISIFESFSGKEINRLKPFWQANNFYFLDDKYLLVVLPFNVDIVDLRTNKTIATFSTGDAVFTSDFNLKSKILAVSTIQNIITFDCNNNQVKLIISIPSKPVYHLSLSPDGSVLAGLRENKIFCWTAANLMLKGSIDATSIKSFAAASDFLITIKTEPFSYQYYHFDGTVKSAAKEFIELRETVPPRITVVADGFFMESYKRVVFIDSEGYQTVLKTEDYYKAVRFSAVQSKIVTIGFDRMNVIDFEGIVHATISTEQLFPADMYYDKATEKNILILDSQIVFSASGKETHKFKLKGKYAGKAIEKDNWMIVPHADAGISIWDIKTEKQLYEVTYEHIPYLIVPDQKKECLYISEFSDSAVYRIDLKTGNKTIIYKDNAPVSAIAFEDDLLFTGNIFGVVKVIQLQPGNAALKHKASLFGNGISKIVVLENKLMIASHGRIAYLKNNLSDSVNTTLFIGHNGLIKDIVVSPDKRFFISTANDKVIKLWDIKKNRLVQSYNLDSVSADRLQILDNHGYLFYGSGFLMGAVTDTLSVNKFMNPANEIVVQSPNNNAPLKMAINKEGNLLASVDNNTVKVRDLKSGFLISEFATENKTVNGISFTTDGKMLAVAAGNAVECFDPYTGKLIREIELDKRGRSIHDVEAYNNAIVAINNHGWHNPLILHKNSGLKLGEIWYNPGDKIDKQLRDFKCTANGSLLITYGSDYIKVFENAENPKNTLTIPLIGKGKTNRNYIDFMNISPEGKYLLYVDFTDVSFVKIIDLKSGTSIKEHKGGIGAIGKNGKYIYAFGSNKLALRNVNSDSLRVLDFIFDGIINNVVYNDQADVFAISDTWGNIKILEGRTGSLISENSRWDQYTYNSILSADGRYMLFNNRWGLYTVDLRNLKREAIPAENYPLSGVFSPASDKIYFRKGTTFYVKELASGRIDSIFTTTVTEDDIESIGISNDGKILYFSTTENDLVFIHIENRKQFWGMNKFKVKGWDGFVLRQMLFKEGKYQLLGAGIKTYGEQSGLTYISLEADDNMNFVKRSPEIKLVREGKGFEKLVFERDAKIFDVSPDGKYFSYMKNLELYIIEISTGDTIFNRDNPVSGNIVTGFFTQDKKYYIIGMDDGYAEVYDLSKKGKAYKYGETASGLFQVKRFRANESGISSMQLAGNRLLIKGNNAFTSLFKPGNAFRKELDIDFIKSEDQIFISPSGYYYSTKNALNYIAFKRDVFIYPFEQLDSKYNRPDKVLEEMNNTDTALIRLYKRAYNKRIKKLGIDTTRFSENSIVPEAGFENVDAIAFEQRTEKLSLKFKAIDTGYQLDNFNVWINEVPLFGMKGISIRQRNKYSFDTTIAVHLSQGENRIEASVTNANGNESYRMPLYVKYTAVEPVKEAIHFIGIGINEFADSKRNLQWCVKDIRDLVLNLKEKYGNNIIIDTLFNQNVTLSNVQALKQKLLNTKINDKVIIAYSGHGLLSKQYDYYLSSYTVNFKNPEINGIAYEEIENLLDGIPARKKLLLIDACHSGEVDKDELLTIQNNKNKGNKGLIMNRGSEDETVETKTVGLQNSFEIMQSLFVNVGKGTGATIISAAGGVQFAQERDDLENGVFTFSLLEAMQQNKTIKVSELKKYVGQRVEELTNGQQKPTTRNELKDFDWIVW